MYLSGVRRDERHRVPGVVDEELLPGAVHLAHRALEPLAKAPVVPAELAVAVGGVGLRCVILLPQQLQRDALALELLVELAEIGLRVGHDPCRRARKQPRLKLRIIDFGGKRPGDTGREGAPHILGDRPLGQAGSRGNAFVAQPRLELQPQHFLDLAHGFPLRWHPCSRENRGG